MRFESTTRRPLARRPPGRAGFTLIEMLAYIFVLTIVLAVAYVGLHRCLDNSVALQRSVNDIARTLRIGEQWRADVRAAQSAVRQETAPAGETLRLRTAAGEISYRFSGNAVFRRAGNGPEIRVLDHVKTSAMQSDRRQAVTAWRWELELQTRAVKYSHTRPLFTFIAVPSGASSP